MSTDRYDFTEREFQLHNSGAKLLYISSAKYNGDWYSFPHTHNFTEVFYVIGGAGKFQIRDSYYKVSVGDMVILNPNIEHTETSMVDDPLEYIVLGIRGIKMSAELDPKQDFSIIHFNEAAEEIQRYLLAMLQEAKNKKNDYEEVCGHLLDILLICLMRQTNITSRVQEADLTHQNKAAAAKEYIDAHFREDIALDQLAQKIQVNKYYLAHIFSQSYGMSPHPVRPDAAAGGEQVSAAHNGFRHQADRLDHRLLVAGLLLPALQQSGGDEPGEIPGHGPEQAHRRRAGRARPGGRGGKRLPGLPVNHTEKTVPLPDARRGDGFVLEKAAQRQRARMAAACCRRPARSRKNRCKASQ